MANVKIVTSCNGASRHEEEFMVIPARQTTAQRALVRRVERETFEKIAAAEELLNGLVSEAVRTGATH